MPTFRQIKLADIDDKFDSLSQAQAFIRKKQSENNANYNFRRREVGTLAKDQWIDDILFRDWQIEIAARDEEVQEQDDESKVYLGSRIPQVREETGRKRSGYRMQALRVLNQENNTFNPRFIQIHLNDAFVDVIDPDILGSDDKHSLRTSIGNARLQSKFVKTQSQLINHKSRIKRLIKRDLGLGNSLQDRETLTAVMGYLKFKEYVIDLSNLDDVDLIYYMNGRIRDFTQYVISRCSTDPTESYVDFKGKKLNCVLSCILDQNSKYFGVRKRKTLVKKNRKDITFEFIKNIAEEFKLYIKILDCEADLWKIYDHRDRTPNEKRKSGKNKNIVIMVHNGHARNINEKYRIGESHSRDSNAGLSLDYVVPYIKPISDDEVKEEIFKLDARIHLDRKESKMTLLIQGKEIPYKEIEDHYVVFIEDDSLEPYLEYLVQDGILPSIIGGRNCIIALNITLGYGKTKKILQIRDSSSNHDLLGVVPYYHNYTLGSSTMYLFKRFIEQSILKISDPTICRLFKHLCKPTIFMKQHEVSVSENKKVILIDLKKAYKNRTHDLGSFEKQPEFKMNVNWKKKTRMNAKLEDGIYEVFTKKETRWITRDELSYLLERGDRLRHRFYIPYNSRTNTLDDFSNAVYDPDNDELDVCVKTRKNMVNVLIGKLNPNIDAIKGYAVFGNQVDLDRFLMKGNKTIFKISEIVGRDNQKTGRWVVEYSLDTTDNYMIGTNATYLSAQVINRCKLDVLKMSDRLKQNGAEIIGSMTDSILFVVDSDSNILELMEDSFSDNWDIQVVGDSILSRGVGQYKIMRKGELIHERHLGSSETLENEFLKSILSIKKIQKEKEFDSLTKNIENYTKSPALPTIIIGRAGYGKSTKIRKDYMGRDWIRVAYTGIASAEISGSTINSLFKLGQFGDKTVEEALYDISKQKRQRLIKASGIVVDEYYTTPAKIMNKVNEILKFIRGSSLPFGGLDVVLVGDDRQTSAIGLAFVDSPLYSDVFADAIREELESHDNMRLTKEYDKFCCLLRNPRITTEKVIKLLKDKRLASDEVPGRTVYFDNKSVDDRNIKELSSFDGPVIEIAWESSDPSYPSAKIKRYFKKGCPIRIENNYNGFYNGSLVKFEDYNTETDTVKISNNDEIIELDKDKIKFRLAFALTIHSAQCKTFEGINIYFKESLLKKNKDLSLRLLYTAMTRVRDFSKCYINVTK